MIDNKNDTFRIYFGDNDAFRVNDVLRSNSGKLIVTSTPKKSKWRRFFNVITFGLVKIEWNYTVKPYTEEDDG